MLDAFRLQTLSAVATVCLSCQSLIAADTSLPESIAGTWVLQQAASPNELQRELRRSLATAFETPKIRGFCLRFPWKAADEDFSLIEAGLKIARDHGVAYSIRFMAGRHTPDRVFAKGCRFYLGGRGGNEKVPVPFLADGSPNSVFEAEYEAYVNRLAVSLPQSRGQAPASGLVRSGLGRVEPRQGGSFPGGIQLFQLAAGA
jgi:hypothetical protein